MDSLDYQNMAPTMWKIEIYWSIILIVRFNHAFSSFLWLLTLSFQEELKPVVSKQVEPQLEKVLDTWKMDPTYTNLIWT